MPKNITATATKITPQVKQVYFTVTKMQLNGSYRQSIKRARRVSKNGRQTHSVTINNVSLQLFTRAAVAHIAAPIGRGGSKKPLCVIVFR